MATVEQEAIEQDKEEKKHAQKNDYCILDYFKEHTGLAVTCVSAIVAITSFVFNYAVVLQNAAFMRYWNIHTAYMADSKGIQFYTVFAAFIYGIMVVLVHALLSKTADVYRHDNVLASRGKYVIKDLKRHHKKLLKEKREIDRELQNVSSTEEQKCLQDRLNKILKDIKLHEMNDPETKSAIHGVKVRIASNVAISIGVSLLICVLGIVFFGVTVSEQLDIKLAILISLPVLFLDLLLYFVPAYFATRPKKIKDTDIVDMAYELIEGRTPMFPLEGLIHKGVKPMVSDMNIRMMLIQYVTTIIVCIFLFAQLGANGAKSSKEFPIYTDETGTYAVVYNNGDSLILKSANIEETEIEIDVRQQKVVSASDISYEIRTFETVIVTGKDGEK